MFDNIRKKRQNISDYVHNNLDTNYKDKKIVFYECPTGSGKTAIIMRAAYTLMKKYNTSVIISTVSNQLANNAIKEGIEDANKYYNLDIEEDDVELLLGKSNFLDIEAVKINIDMKAEGFEDISFDDVQKWYDDKKNRKLVEKFISDFNLQNINPKYISYLGDYDGEDIVTIKNFPDFLLEKNKIYVTNHLFLITLSEVLTKNIRYKKYAYLMEELPIFLDEAHELKKLAKLKYTRTFSTYRLKLLFSTLTKGAKITPEARKLEKDIRNLFNTTTSKTSSVSETRKAIIYDQLIAFNEKYSEFRSYGDLEKKRKSKKTHLFIKIINGIDKSNKEKTIARKLLKNEFYEFLSVLNIPNKKNINFTFSAKKGYLKAATLSRDPKFELRKHFWTKIGNVTLFSGTYRVNRDDLSPQNNLWTLARIGLYNYGSDSLEGYKQHFNKRIKRDVKFKVFKWLFPKENLKYMIVDRADLQPPSYSNDKSETTNNKEEWAKRLAYFYNYYIDSFKNENLLLLTGGYADTRILFEAFNNYINKDKIFYETEKESLHNLLDRYKESASTTKGNILMGTLSCYTGINLYHDLCTMVFMTKLPYAPFTKLDVLNIPDMPSSVFKSTFKKSYDNEMVLMFRQGLGRASRTEDDHVIMFIFDDKINTSKKRKLKDFISEMGLGLDFERDFIGNLDDYQKN